MLKNQKLFRILFVFVGVAGLLFKRIYNGPYHEIVVGYLGNISVSFAVYFIVSFYENIWKENKLLTAGVALLALELFELTNGFGIMSNTYDPFDFIANCVGVALAFLIDLLIKRILIQKIKT